jgi:hypothetical protein
VTGDAGLVVHPANTAFGGQVSVHSGVFGLSA